IFMATKSRLITSSTTLSPNLTLSPITPHPPNSTFFPYTTLFRSDLELEHVALGRQPVAEADALDPERAAVRRDEGHQPRQLAGRSEEHTSELQSRENVVCSLLLEKKNCLKCHG